MATLSHAVLLADGSPAPGAVVTIELTDGDGEPVVGYSSSGVHVARHSLRADEDGEWSVEAIPNSDITPANTYYKVTEAARGEAGHSALYEMPDVDSWLGDILVSIPSPLGSLVGSSDGTLFGSVSLVGGLVQFTIPTKWGINDAGVPYYDAVNPIPEDERALLTIDPSVQELVWIKLAEVF